MNDIHTKIYRSESQILYNNIDVNHKEQSGIFPESDESFQEPGFFNQIEMSDIWVYSVYYELPTPLDTHPAIRAIALAPFHYKRKGLQSVFCHTRLNDGRDLVTKGRFIVVDSQYKKGVTK